MALYETFYDFYGVKGGGGGVVELRRGTCIVFQRCLIKEKWHELMHDRFNEYLMNKYNNYLNKCVY